MDLSRDVFNHGQLYVAMYRVRPWDSFKIYFENHQRVNLQVKNYVYKELFLWKRTALLKQSITRT